MTLAQLGYLGTFVFGTLFGVVLTIAIFRSSLAVLESKQADHTRRIDRVEKHVADVMLKVGASQRYDDQRGSD